MFWITDAVMELDLDCWPSGDAARLNAHFSEAEVAGRRRVQARDDLSDTLMRAADAFERADTTAVQQLLGLPSGWVETSSIVTGSAGLNNTALSNLLPAPASFLATANWTGGGPPDWESIFRTLGAGYLIAAIVLGGIGLLMSGGLPYIAILVIAVITLSLLLPHMTLQDLIDAFKWAGTTIGLVFVTLIVILTIIFGILAIVLLKLPAIAAIIALIGIIIIGAITVIGYSLQAALQDLVEIVLPRLFPELDPNDLIIPSPPPSKLRPDKNKTNSPAYKFWDIFQLLGFPHTYKKYVTTA